MKLVEPLAFLFTNQEEPTLTRYYAQEALATMANYLNARTAILEALYECLADDRILYDQFCDRLDTGLLPFVTLINGVHKLEYQLPQSHVFSVKTVQPQVYLPLHPRRYISDQKGDEVHRSNQSFSSEFHEYMGRIDSDYNPSEVQSQKSIRTVLVDKAAPRATLGEAGKLVMGARIPLQSQPSASEISERLRILKSKSKPASEVKGAVDHDYLDQQLLMHQNSLR